jgi:hypothetical protein
LPAYSRLLERIDVELHVLVLAVERHASRVADPGRGELGRVPQRDARLDPERWIAAVRCDVEDVHVLVVADAQPIRVKTTLDDLRNPGLTIAPEHPAHDAWLAAQLTHMIIS